MAYPTSRPRSAAAVVLTRADGQAPGSPAAVRRPAAEARRRRLGPIVSWTVLALLVVGLWVLLLAGDSLVVSG
jgi:hypothetical protein